MQPHHKQSNSSYYSGCESLICTTVVFSPAYKIHKEPLLLQQVIKSQWDKHTKWNLLLTKRLLLLTIKSLFFSECAGEKHLRSGGRIWHRFNRHLLDVSVVPTVIPSPLTSPVLMTYAVTSPERRKQKGNAVVIWSSPNNGHPTYSTFSDDMETRTYLFCQLLFDIQKLLYLLQDFRFVFHWTRHLL